jgi:hypothetical protein
MPDLARLRLLSQRLEMPADDSPQALLAYMGAMQSQDEPMSKAALGLRLPGSKAADIQAACDRGELIRTHVLRPTWHLVAAQDLRWMLALSAAQIKASMRIRDGQLGVTEALIEAGKAVCQSALAGGRALTREALAAEMIAAGIPATGGVLVHLLVYAEVDAVICSGPQQAGKSTYALVDERVPAQAPLTRAEAVARLALTYFRSHGPATLKDFTWWSGLNITECRRGLAEVQGALQALEQDGETYWMAPGLADAPALGRGLHLLPAFDEFIISYRDRTAAFPLALQGEAITSNGIFRPVIVWDGQVVGTWARTHGKQSTRLEAKFFASPQEEQLLSMTAACERLAAFWGQPVRHG